MSQPDYRIAIDIGNSAAKVLVEPIAGVSVEAGPGKVCDSRSVKELPQASFLFASQIESQGDWTEQLCRWLVGCLSPKRANEGSAPVQIQWWVSTVNHRASEQLKRVLADEQNPRPGSNESGLLREVIAPSSLEGCWREISYRDIPLRLQVDRPQRVGIDRLLGAFGAANRFGAPVMVVDAGSAITVDLVTKDSAEVDCSDERAEGSSSFVFCGGAILPGLRMQQRALAAGAEALANFGSLSLAGEDASKSAGSVGLSGSGSAAHPGPARDTGSAIQLGVQAATVGGVTWLWQKYQENLHQDESQPKIEELPIVVTGGDGTEISAYLGQCHELVPNLVCLGLLDLARSATA